MKEILSFSIGLMSGTSLDGLDIVYVQFNTSNYSNFKILHSETIPYSTQWKYDLQNAITFSEEKIEQLNNDYGSYLAEKTIAFITKNKISKIDFIASHGHTVFHQPENGITLQIGDGQQIANLTKQKVICDFRTQDVAFGGQGAPLVPIGDQLLFAKYNYCLNLGGFANISMTQLGDRVAFDICPVNIVLNHYVSILGLTFDDGGEIAKKGNLNLKLLQELNTLDFYKKSAPKSLGLEWVQQCIFPLIDSYNLEIPTILRTFIEHVAQQISAQLKAKDATLFITGGGVYNLFLIERLKQLSTVEIIIPSNEIVEYKEALIFAFLGLLRNQNKVNVLASVTGAKKNHSSGKIYEELK